MSEESMGQHIHWSLTGYKKYWPHDTVPVWVYQETPTGYTVTLIELDKNKKGNDNTGYKVSGYTQENYTVAKLIDTLKPSNYKSTSTEDVLKAMIEGGKLSEEQIAQINVYREGNYNELMPNSYNNETLCKTIGGTLVNGKCNL